MKQGTKQRIVGSVVLLSLALIFLPIIFDGQGSYQTPVSSRIPDAPSVPVLPQPQQTRPEIIGDREPAESATASPEPVDAASRSAPATVANEEEPGASDTDSSAAESDANVAIVESEPAFARNLPQLDASGLPQGWSVRLGSFADNSNATGLMQRLQEAGYKAYTRTSAGNQGQLTVVFVGPWLERGRADDYLAELQDEFQLAGMVVRYEIEQL